MRRALISLSLSENKHTATITVIIDENKTAAAARSFADFAFEFCSRTLISTVFSIAVLTISSAGIKQNVIHNIAHWVPLSP